MANPERKSKASSKENTAPDPKGHEGEIWHRPFSYKTKAGVTVKVEGHWERKPGAAPQHKSEKAPRAKATKKAKEEPHDGAASKTEAEADA